MKICLKNKLKEKLLKCLLLLKFLVTFTSAVHAFVDLSSNSLITSYLLKNKANMLIYLILFFQPSRDSCKENVSKFPH